MSKFFKALEKVESEREEAATALAAEANGSAHAEPAAAAVAHAAVAAPAPPRDEPRLSPFSRRPVTPPPVAGPVEPPAEVDRTPAERAAAERARLDKERAERAERERGERERAERERAERERAERARVEEKERAPVYGAPVQSAPSPFARRSFGWQVDEAAGTEPGDMDDHLVSLLEPTSFAAEQYRAVRLAIENFRRERGTRVVAVSSPGRGDGKTVTAINVAGALAQASDARVALVEADLRHPTVARYLGLPSGRGLSAYLLDSAMSVDAIIERPTSIAFSVIPAGTASSMPYELLKSPRLAALLASLRERFDFVVVDTPAALPYPDVGILRDSVDGFVLVVRANRTPREMLRDTMSVIGRNRGLGLVFNDDGRAPQTTFAGQANGNGWRRYVPRPLGGSRVA